MIAYGGNTVQGLAIGLISAYMNRFPTTLGKTFSRMACTQSFRTKRDTGTSGFSTDATPQPDTIVLAIVFTEEQILRELTLILVYLWVDYYMRHANLLGRLLREATGGVQDLARGDDPI